MKIGVISDTHGFLDPRVEKIFAGVSHILHAGDIGYASIILELQFIAPVTAVLGNTDGDIQGADVGTDDRDFALRAERSGPGDGRTYTAVYQVTDHAGNVTRADALVIVPHDMGHGASGGDHDAEFKAAAKQMAKDAKLSKKSFKQQLSAAKKQAKLNKKAYKALLKAARKGGS